MREHQCYHVALLDGQVVGWCDVLPAHGESRAHMGALAMGVAAAACGQGINPLLLRRAVGDARARGLLRIELTVRTDNLPAKALHQREGFAVEGILRRGFRVDGEFFDCCAMALLKDGAGVRV